MRLPGFAVTPMELVINSKLSDKSKVVYMCLSALVDRSFTLTLDATELEEVRIFSGCSSVKSMGGNIKELKANGYLDYDYDRTDMKYIIRMGTYSEAEVVDRKIERSSSVSEGFVDSIYEKWNSLFQCKRRKTPDVRSKIIARTKLFSEDEILKAMDNFHEYASNDSWWSNESNRKHLTNIERFFRNDRNVEEYLNLDPESNVKISNISKGFSFGKK